MRILGSCGETYCGGAFVVFPDTVAGFFEIGDAPGKASFLTAEWLVWRSADLETTPYEDAWFPREARQTGGHHLFVREGPEDEFRYLGLGDLASAGGETGDLRASFRLRERISNEDWIRWTGFDGWLLNVDHKPFQIEGGDTARLLKALKAGLKKKRSHVQLTRYEGDVLEVFFNRERAWPMYLRYSGDNGLYLETSGGEVEYFECSCGSELEIPRSGTLDRGAAEELLRHFFEHGALPASLAWTEEFP